MFPRLPKVLVAIALACSIGLHWACLQSVAWVGMMISYAHDGTLKEAVVKTFDGKHPCPLCKQIAQGKRAEKKSAQSLELKKFEFLGPHSQFVFNAPTHFWLIPAADDSVRSVPLAPPTPPPRGALV